MGLLSDNARASSQTNMLADLLRGFTGGVNNVSSKLAGLLSDAGSFDQSMADSAQENIGNKLAGLLGNPQSPAIFNTPQQQQIMSMAGSLMPMGITKVGGMLDNVGMAGKDGIFGRYGAAPNSVMDDLAQERANRVSGIEDDYRLPNLHNAVPKDYLPPQYGKPTVTVYRGVPSTVSDASIRPGDWGH